jgi:plasmid maintenance system killer protein
VQVKFRTSQLREAFERHQSGVRLWSEEIARKYVQRVKILEAADSVDDLFKVPPLKFHPHGNGKYSVVLLGRAKLIATFEDLAMTIAWVEEVNTDDGD